MQIKAVNAPLSLLPASASLLSSGAPSSSVQAVWKLLSSGLLEGLPLWSFWHYTEMEVSKNVPGSLTLECTLTWHVGGPPFHKRRAPFSFLMVFSCPVPAQGLVHVHTPWELGAERPLSYLVPPRGNTAWGGAYVEGWSGRHGPGPRRLCSSTWTAYLQWEGPSPLLSSS